MNMIRRIKNQPELDLVQLTDVDSKRPGRRVVFELLLAIALSVGCWYTFFSMFSNPVDPVVTAVLIAALPVGLYLLCWNPFLGRFLFLCVFAVVILFCVIAHKDVWNGFLVMGNAMIEALNKELGAGLTLFHAAGDTVDWSRDAFIAMIPVTLLASMAIVHSIYHKEPLLGFIFTGFPVIVGLWLEATPSIWLLLLLLLCWTGIFVLSAVARPVSHKKNRPIYIQNEKNSSLPYIFLSFTLVVLLGYVLIFSGNDYRPPQSVEEAKNAAIELQERLRYDPLGGEKIDALAQGDLTKTHPLEYTGNTVLKLETQEPHSMYLRGFVGGTFERGRWSPDTDQDHANSGAKVTQTLARRDFYPWTQQQRLYSMAGDSQSVAVNAVNINGSSKYLYLPYEAVPQGDASPEQANYEKDHGVLAKGPRGQRAYSFQTFAPRFQDYNEEGLAAWAAAVKLNPNWSDYADEEMLYCQYAQEAYLHVSKKDAAALGTTGIDRCQGTSIEYTLNYIRANFSAEFTYDVKKEAVKDGKDELYEFLNEDRRGNDMHFATAAALMFRQAGIPARYVEGYYLSPEEISRYAGKQNVSIDVRDSHAHSWVEVYVDEIGWFPVEVVPGFYQTQQLQGEGADGTGYSSGSEKIYRDQDQEEPDQRDQQTRERQEKNIIWWWLLLLVILAAAALYEYLGRQRVKKRLAAFCTDYSQQQVYAMYHYLEKIMAFDKHPLPADPYERLAEFSMIYDKDGGLSFEGMLRLVYRVRFGGEDLTPQEHEQMAGYAQWVADQVYGRQNQTGRFLMKFILFYV
ncbi:transglutaminase domain-containing protein [Clostridiales bacterium]|nr:transglutaminase domain-containing protein [Clostridiales bacterium]